MIVLYSPADKPFWDNTKRKIAGLGESAVVAFHQGMRMEVDKHLLAGQRILLDDERRFLLLVNDG